jgi:hypothetical protein
MLLLALLISLTMAAVQPPLAQVTQQTAFLIASGPIWARSFHYI